MINIDLDAEIAKTIFKWRYIPVSGDANGENKCEILYPPGPDPGQDFYNTLPRIGKIHEGWHTPQWSNNLYEALKLAQHIKLPWLVSSIPLNPEELSKLCLDWYKEQTTHE
jgi:hypothetical protein